MGFILAPPLKFTGSMTHGSFPAELPRSPESMQTAEREPSKPAGEAGSLGSRLAAVRANVLPRNLSISWGFVLFFPTAKLSVRYFQPDLLCVATAAPNEKSKKA